MPSVRSVARDAGVRTSSLQRRRRRLGIVLRPGVRHTLTHAQAARLAPEPFERSLRPGWMTEADIRRRWPDARRDVLRRELETLESVRALPPGRAGKPSCYYAPEDVLRVIDACRPPRGLWRRARLREACGASKTVMCEMVAQGLPSRVWAGEAWHDPRECARWLMAHERERWRRKGRVLAVAAGLLTD